MKKIIAAVCPACAGMILLLNGIGRALVCLPRMRGDDPSLIVRGKGDKQFAPHARG